MSPVPTLKIAFPRDIILSEYEPTRIHLAHEYILLENLYSTLVEFDADGNITSGVAKTFAWHGDELVFEIRPDAVTASGLPITAEDVEFSLKRVLVLTGNTHGNLNDLLCPGLQLKSVSNPCPGIERRGNLVVLKPGGHKPFLIPMLAALDFAIIPRSAVAPDLKIADFAETSGPYFVSKAGEDGIVRFEANHKHYRYHPRMPHVIELVSAQHQSSFELYKAGKIDLITTIDAHRPEEQLEFAETLTDAALHQTLPLRTFLLRFTPQGLKKFSAALRLSLGKAIRTGLHTYIEQSKGFQETKEFFPPFGVGELLPDQKKLLEGVLAKADEGGWNTPLKIAVIRIGNHLDFEKQLLQSLPNAQFANGQDPGGMDNADAILGGPDTGFLEDIGLISYSINFGMLAETPEEGRAWLKIYMELQNKEERIQMLKKLHLSALERGLVTPFALSPYVAIARKPWTHGLSRFFGNNPFYFMRHE